MRQVLQRPDAKRQRLVLAARCKATHQLRAHRCEWRRSELRRPHGVQAKTTNPRPFSSSVGVSVGSPSPAACTSVQSVGAFASAGPWLPHTRNCGGVAPARPRGLTGAGEFGATFDRSESGALGAPLHLMSCLVDWHIAPGANPSTTAATAVNPRFKFIVICRRRCLKLFGSERPHVPIGLNIIAPRGIERLAGLHAWMEQRQANGGNYLRAWPKTRSASLHRLRGP
jgi:hypothetical protein